MGITPEFNSLIKSPQAKVEGAKETSISELKQCLYCGASFNPTSTSSSDDRYCCSACQHLAQFEINPPSSTYNFSKYKELDLKEIQQKYQNPNVPGEFSFYVKGLECASCIHLLEKIPEFYSDVISSEVLFSHSIVKVHLKESASLAKVASLIEEMGYEPSIILTSENVFEKNKLENRDFLKRIAIAGAVTGNIMLFVVPIYAGLAGNWATAFNWISFFLFLPIVFYSATPFYRGALNALKFKVVNIDLPITIALLASFLLSTFNLFRGNGALYFDSTASFIFLILSSRYLLKRVQQKFLSTPSGIRLPSTVVKLENGNEVLVSTEKISPNDHIKLPVGLVLPFDGLLISDRAHLDMSLLNGESLPRTFTKGMTIQAGTRILNEPIEISVLRSGAKTEFGGLLETLEKDSVQQTYFVGVTDKISQWLIVSVFAFAILFFIFYINIDFNEAFNRSLALIVLACPCALALGTPLTFGLALKYAQKEGIIIKNGAVLEKILKIKNIFFDKTGTLTEGKLSIAKTFPPELPETTKSIILTLESISNHPVAFAIREAWGQLPLNNKLNDIHEEYGTGVFAEYEGQSLSLTGQSKAGLIIISLKENNKTIAELYFTDEIRDTSPQVIKAIKKMKLPLKILSGDTQENTELVGIECGIEKQNCFGKQTPNDKLNWIQKFDHSIMIGDGANDSLALQAASVGIAVRGSMDLSLKHADVYFTDGGLDPLLKLFAIAKKSHQTLYRNLLISLIYNFLGGTLALSGYITPMIAAILMPLSSAAIVISTLIGQRRIRK